jgi:hypothetical protein
VRRIFVGFYERLGTLTNFRCALGVMSISDITDQCYVLSMFQPILQGKLRNETTLLLIS